MNDKHFVKPDAAESHDRQVNDSVQKCFTQVVGNSFKQFCTNTSEIGVKRAEKRVVVGSRIYGHGKVQGEPVRIETDEPAQQPEYTPELLRDLLRQKPRIYKRILVDKKGTSEKREVVAPIKPLKRLQRLLLMHLYKTTSVDKAAHGFVPRKGNWTAAALIAAGMKLGRQNTVLTQDLSKAFPSITERQVREVLKRSGLKGFQLHVATRIATFEGRLATGAPSSPWILNLIMTEVDRKMRGWAEQRGGNFVRYADDCTLQLPTWRRRNLKVGRELLRRLCREAGLELHKAKHKTTRIGLDSDSAEVIGLAVQPQLATRPRRHRRRLRGLVRQALKAKARGDEERFNRVSQTIFGLAAYFAGQFLAMKHAKQERIKKLRFSTA
jgi:hypothetical protein